MIYPKNPYCPFDKDYMCPENGNNGNNNNNNTPGDDCSCPGNGNGNGNSNNDNSNGNNGSANCAEMMKQISELEFAITDINLYLDTHPDNKEALELFTKLSATLHSLKYDYGRNCAPICATDVKNSVPFEWVSTAHKWPWQA